VGFLSVMGLEKLCKILIPALNKHKLDNVRLACNARHIQGPSNIMTYVQPIPLEAAIVRLQGSDALAFAQSQFSSDVNALQIGSWQWSAWLDAKGRVVALFHLVYLNPDELLLVLRGCDATRVAKGLARYVFRSRVEITTLPALPMVDADNAQAFSANGDVNELTLGLDSYAVHIGSPHAANSQWRHAAMQAGHPWLVESLHGTLLPPALSLRRLGAVSFSKGCFPGQEIVARMHYRGRHKYQLCHVMLPNAVPPGLTWTPSSDDEGNLVVLDCIPRDGDLHEAIGIAHERVIETWTNEAENLQVQVLGTFPT
jgi:folate-binding protein YgfZ